MTNTLDFDVVIVGGGMVGAASGCALGDSSLRVAVLEDNPPEPFNPEQPHDLRVSALSIASVSLLKTIGAWHGITTRRLCPFRRMRVWEGVGATEFCSDDIHEPVLGYIVENRIIQLALLDRLTAFDNITLLSGIKSQLIDYQPGSSTVQLDDGRVVRARLLVAGDGAQSKVRQAAGLGVSSWDYEHRAMVLGVETAYEQQDITWQRFVPSGPQAFLPLDGNHASLVWYEDPDRIKYLLTLSDEELLQALQADFPAELGNINRIEARGTFPLRRQHAQHYVKPGVALMGDAAHTIHPLAGQGVNIGLLDAAALAQVLVEAMQRGEDIAALSVLRRYEKMRRRDNLVMMTIMDMFYRVFGNDNIPLKLVRNLGLGLAHHITPARKFAMRFAMGLEGNLPKLSRGITLLS